MKEFRNACGKFATGIVIITTEVDGEVHGMTANGFMSVSLDPSLLLVSIGNDQKMFDCITKSNQYAISILSTEQEAWSQHFAGAPQDDLKVEFSLFQNVKVVPNALAYFTTNVVSSHLEGDHTLFIGKVDYYKVNDELEPLLYYKGYKKLESNIKN
jgi:flavin reductase (DIM6/NTAB) family NADH-FMN oxidoreductase RutF